MAQAIEYLLATPTISPHLPAKSFMSKWEGKEEEVCSASAAATSGAGAALARAARIGRAVRTAAALLVVGAAAAAVPLRLTRPVALSPESRLTAAAMPEAARP